MCDTIPDTDHFPVILETRSFPEKEALNQNSTEDETSKDLGPEVIGKVDYGSKASLQFIEKLSNGVLSFYIKDMKKSSMSLNELRRNQTIAVETLEQENSRATDALKMYPMDQMFSRIKQYHQKIQLLKKEMFLIHERTAKLKKRAMRLQQQKQKEALYKELQRDREMERDKQLAPKIVTKSNPGK